MATITVTNTKAQPAYKGQGCLVTSASSIEGVAVGQVCQLDSNGKYGTVVWVDNINNQFKIVPQYPYSNLASSGSPGLFAVNEDVIVTTS